MGKGIKAEASLGASLPEGSSGSSFLYELLAGAIKAFPAVFKDVKLPANTKRFRSSFGDVLTRFEAARASSSERVEIATAMRKHVGDRMRFVTREGSKSLAEAACERVSPIAMRVVKTEGAGRLVPSVQLGETTHQVSDLRLWLASALHQHKMTEAAASALGKLLDRADAEGGLSLRGERFVVMGAAAELAPTEALLAAGATVLWIDVKEPPRELLRSKTLGGVLYVPEVPCDLLTSLASIVATIVAFSEGQSVHIGMYAYAGGESQEWRLAESMNAIVTALPPSTVKSVSLLVSPTTVIATHKTDVAAGEKRRHEAGTVMRSLGKLGLLGASHVSSSETSVASAIVALQGASYQAAQYVGKILAAEVFGSVGIDGQGPFTTSANIAPITATRSLSHPLFEAGFLFAPNFGVWIAKPATTRALQALLMIADVTDPQAPGSSSRTYSCHKERASALFSEQIHGGVFAQPYAFESMIRMAAIGGLTKKPSLLAKLVRQ